MRLIIITAAAVLLAAPAIAGEQSVVRDAGGRTIGTATTDSQGTTTFRDSRGVTTGTASTTGNTTTFRDSRGVTTGTATAPFGRNR